MQGDGIKMLDLIELLPEKDKELMKEYIYQYGIGEKDFIGLEAYLKDWADSKKKLYRLLGNQFQVEIPYAFEKTEAVLINELNDLLNHSFIIKYHNNFISKCDVEIATKLWNNESVRVYKDNKLTESVRIKPILDGKKEIQLQQGMKPLRALQKIVDNYPEIFSKEEFEDFRIKHSMCLNDKTIKGNLVISIHPFDFITMSDNACDWSSCMSWTDHGCYHVGTVEMMNSNNVVCAYITSENPYCFDYGKKNKELVWNNKKWRQLFYVTKDIIVGGKAYPYRNKDITITILDNIKKLAQKNLSWEYTYGPEKYQDMKHINHLHQMLQNKNWLSVGDSTKHNIIFDTNGMYNDMLNDNTIDYWCYRNKVKRMKIISYSGKVPCICCGKHNVLEISDYIEDYNDRYRNTESIVCDKCDDEGTCTSCDIFTGRKTLIPIKKNGRVVERMCPTCFDTYYKICPCCGEVMPLHPLRKENLPGIRLTAEDIYYNDYYFFDSEYYGRSGYFNSKNYQNYDKITPYSTMKVAPVFMCDACIEKELKNPNSLFTKEKLKRSPKNVIWYPLEMNKIITKKVYTKEEISNHPLFSKTLFANLKSPNKDSEISLIF